MLARSGVAGSVSLRVTLAVVVPTIAVPLIVRSSLARLMNASSKEVTALAEAGEPSQPGAGPLAAGKSAMVTSLAIPANVIECAPRRRAVLRWASVTPGSSCTTLSENGGA